MIPNKGQWNEHVQFKSNIGGGNLYVENNRLLFQWVDSDRISKMHIGDSTWKKNTSSLITRNVYAVNFVGVNANAKYTAGKPSTHTYNYFFGNDPEGWVSQVRGYNFIEKRDVY